ncbi:uncharacterized protein CLUP02_04811 [Colletotrichum lupini]|uniref:Uncharacterized protein n=1 Tax=Colletotrichum lupini TaxID=145971 RepID=A0A9Q8SL11_9PEZI|nr:uncharacterized protein CLUP02_04811 [Colletotrichum lupini]UQC79332.1 hypothetical protein CLUP02_04811 [Colletotrichum lupini]
MTNDPWNSNRHAQSRPVRGEQCGPCTLEEGRRSIPDLIVDDGPDLTYPQSNSYSMVGSGQISFDHYSQSATGPMPALAPEHNICLHMERTSGQTQPPVLQGSNGSEPLPVNEQLQLARAHYTLTSLILQLEYASGQVEFGLKSSTRKLPLLDLIAVLEASTTHVRSAQVRKRTNGRLNHHLHHNTKIRCAPNLINDLNLFQKLHPEARASFLSPSPGNHILPRQAPPRYATRASSHSIQEQHVLRTLGARKHHVSKRTQTQNRTALLDPAMRCTAPRAAVSSQQAAYGSISSSCHPRTGVRVAARTTLHLSSRHITASFTSVKPNCVRSSIAVDVLRLQRSRHDLYAPHHKWT